MSDVDAGKAALDLDDGAAEAATPAPYEFDPGDVPVAVAIVDGVFSSALDGFLASSAVIETAAAHNLTGDSPLVQELVLAACYPLRLNRRGRPGCELGPATGDAETAWPRAIASVEEPTVRLWRAVAEAATAPAAIARFEDLLFCRRDGNGLARATRAALAYLEVAHRCGLDMEAVEALVRAWTLARRVRDASLDARVRQKLAESAADILANAPGERPGAVLPMLGALAAGPVVARGTEASDPVDVDDLLERAAAVFIRGDLATDVAGYRRSRTQDPVALEKIARDEVAGYFREAEAAATPAVRMHHLEAAARVAHSRSLSDLARVATAEMQRIKPSELGLQLITASGSLPRFVPESWLRQFTRSSDWRDAIEWFLAGPPPSGDIEHLEEHERQTRGALSRLLFPATVLGRDGLPRATAKSDEEGAAHEMSFAARISAENFGRLMAEGLRRVADRYGIPSEDELVTLFMRVGCCDVRLGRSLAKAFRHFWNGDYESCVHLAAPKVEAAARSLLRELDEGVYRVQVGRDPGGYPGLYILLDELEKLALDKSWAYFFRWLLLGPYGANVRNEVAHGFVSDISPTYAALTLRAASVLVTVAGPPTTDGLEPDAASDRDADASREREDVLGLLAEPLPHAGWIDSLGGWISRQLERGWWCVQTVRACERVRRGRRLGRGAS